VNDATVVTTSLASMRISEPEPDAPPENVVRYRLPSAASRIGLRGASFAVCVPSGRDSATASPKTRFDGKRLRGMDFWGVPRRAGRSG
jgi:hypothetical protein